MHKSKTVNRLQDLAMVLLTLSALILLSRISLLGTGWTGRIQSLLTDDPAASHRGQAVDLADTIASLHLVVTDDSEYGRYSQIYVGKDQIQQIIPLFQEALGSASVVGATADKTFQMALNSPSLYLDLTTELPLEVVAAWLGESVDFARNVRTMALTTGENDAAILYLRGGDGSIFRYDTALPASAVRDLAGTFAPNGGRFAYESGYASLAPYTILVSQLSPIQIVQPTLPGGYSAYNLLTALDFNAHTNSRYNESDGSEVVMESPRTLRLSPDGTVSYSSSEETSIPLYRVPTEGEVPSAVEALHAANRLAAVLTESTGASPLYLRAVEATESGYRISYCYQFTNLPVFFPDDSPGLTVIVNQRAITAFTYRCRSYTATEESSGLLPPAMATAIASIHPGSELVIGYVDSGAEALSPNWLVG